MAQTNPRPPAKPSFGLSICPAAAVGVGSASASAPEGSREPGEPVDVVSPVVCTSLPLHLCGMLSFGGWQERLGSTSHLYWGLGGLGCSVSLARCLPCSDRVRVTHWDSAQLQTGNLLLRRGCQRLFLLHLPAWPRRKWVFLRW